ncbi:bifunctional DNA primase/polymerase [Deinococcus aerolatus]|nr:bifunctional DNA primase/polymerase [Deinococcus aerolatus]
MANNGASLIPVGIDKKPIDGLKWKKFQETPASPEQLSHWAENPRTTGFAIVTGRVSQGAEGLDIDQPGFLEALMAAEPKLVAKLAHQRTGGGGDHLLYRREIPAGNLKLAWAPDPTHEEGRAIAIETRGEGGYLVIAHSLHSSGRHYELLTGSWTDLPLLSDDEVKRLHQAARRLCLAPLTRNQVQRFNQTKARRQGDDASVIDAYLERTPLKAALEAAGYMPTSYGRYTRPGGASGSVVLLDGPDGRELSFHHSSNDPLADGRPHDAFDVFATYSHGGDVRAAVRAAAAQLGLTEPSVEGPASSAQEHGHIPQVYAKLDGYYIDRPRRERGQVVGHTPERVTNFIWEPQQWLVRSDGTRDERGTLTVDGSGKHTVQISSQVWSNRKDLMLAIGGYQALCFTTNNTDLARIAQANLVKYHDLPTARGVRSYGLHQEGDEWLELYENGAVSRHDPARLFYSGTPVDPGSRSFRAPEAGTPDQVSQARQAIKQLLHLVTPATALALLGYGVAAAFAPRITPHLGHRLPFVFLAGERESGKTSAAQIVLELVNGNSTRITKATGMSLYQYDVAHSGANNLLTILDEYRPGEIDDGQLRRHHDLGVKWRGSGVASKDHAYELNAPTIIAGEGFTDDAATKSRGVLYFTRKDDRGSLDTYAEVSRLPLWAYAHHLHTLARTTGEEEHLARLESATRLTQAATRTVANPRLQYALTFLAYGLLVLQQDVSPDAFSHDQITQCLREGASNMLAGGTEGVTNLEQFLEQLAFALSRVNDRQMYVVPAMTPEHLILRPRPCLDLVQQQFRERAAIANVALLRQYAERAPFFEAGDTHRQVGGLKNVRGYRLVLGAIPERCEADLLREFDAQLRHTYTP